MTALSITIPEVIGTPRSRRGKLGIAHLRGDQEAINLAERDLRCANVAKAIAQAVEAAPPFTAEQIAALRSLLAD